ncbi:MAG TPA: Imm57 family immunity protein, partial [Geobacteraceae bacterium]|nr:Imm57 family immunity protein [Geobacteraceae bacterium]
LSEDFECYTLNKGKKMTAYLRKLNPEKLAKKCKDEVNQVVSRNKGLFSETALEVCADPASIKERIRELLEALRSSAKCPPEDF